MQPHEFLGDIAAALIRELGGSRPDVHWHTDAMLPADIGLDERGMARLCLALGRWANALGPDSISALGLWRGTRDFGDDPCDLVVQAGRRANDGPSARLVGADDAFIACAEAAAALGASAPAPSVEDGTERLSLVLPETIVPGAPASEPWGRAFQRHRLLIVRETVLSRPRLMRSLAASWLAADFVGQRDAALRLVGDRAVEGQPFDFVGLSARLFGDGLADYVRRLRKTAGGERLRILVTGAPPEMGDIAGVDRIVGRGRPDERLLDAAFDLIRAPAASAARGIAPGRAPAGAPGGSGEGTPTSAPPEESPVPSLVGQTILVVEDVPMNRLLLEAMLAPTGANLVTAATGAEAL
ncbi:MAG: hypothetical protein AAF677_17655, partial [Pseudomonadota bacterium]